MEKSESKAREWSDNNLKPVFLPLKRKYWEQFRDGESSVEYRKLGHRWREKAFPSGRGVILSCGYSGPRLLARVRSCSVVNSSNIDGGDGLSVVELYGANVLVLAIKLEMMSDLPDT